MNEVVYDPKTKQHIKDEIYTHLYGSVNARFITNLDQLIERNSCEFGNAQLAFVYDGQMIRHSQFVPKGSPPIHKTNALSPDLVSPYLELRAERDRLNTKELPYVLGYINQVLNTSDSFDDYIALLPETLHGVLERLRAQCPCGPQELLDSELDHLRSKNAVSIELLKQRLLSNLLMV